MKFRTNTLMIAAALGVTGLGGAPSTMTAELMEPTLVKSSLLRFSHDEADMARRVDAKAYERLAKEEADFAKDAELLNAAIRSEPASFQSTVTARIQQVLAAAHEVSVAGQAPVITELRHALSELAAALRNLNAEFPQSLRATPLEDDVHTS